MQKDGLQTWRDGKILFHIHAPADIRSDKRVYFTPDGSWLISTGWSDHQVRVLDAWTGKVTRILKGHESEVVSIDMGTNSQHVVTATKNHVRIFDVATGEKTPVQSKISLSWKSIVAVALSPNEQFLLLEAEDKEEHALQIIDLSVDRSVAVWFDARAEWYHNNPFSPDSKKLALMWQPTANNGFSTFVDVIDMETRESQFHAQGKNPVWSGDNKQLFTEERNDVLVWDAQQGMLRERVSGGTTSILRHGLAGSLTTLVLSP